MFCGRKPERKTKEHVIPKWLIEMTGDANRTASFGFKKNFETILKRREYSFGQFSFPACDGCNAKYSTLESDVKPILLKILENIGIRSEELSLFLDWLDKVRVGLWLGMKQLDDCDQNSVMVDPNFYIENRIGQYDRMLIIEKSDSRKIRLNFGGVDTLSFALTPSAFTLIVNNICFTNISYMFLVSRRLGFPFSQKTFFRPQSNQLESEISEGKERIILPVIRQAVRERGTKIYQPMFAGGLFYGDLSYYDSGYVRAHSMDHEKGVGNLYIEREGKLSEYGKKGLINFNTSIIQDDRELLNQSSINILIWQNWLSEKLLPSLEQLSPEDRREIKERFRGAVRFNNLLIKHHEEKLQQKITKKKKV